MGRRRDEKKHGGENKIVKGGKVEEGVLTVGDYIAFILTFKQRADGWWGGGGVEKRQYISLIQYVTMHSGKDLTTCNDTCG